MRLHEEASFFLVSLAQIFASFHSFSETSIKIFGLCDASAVCAPATEIWQAIGDDRRQTIHGLRQHERKRIFTRTLRPGKNHGLREALTGQHIAQAMDDVGVAVKI